MTNKIEIIGLGAGDIEQLPLGIYRKLHSEERIVYTRTIAHPVIGELQAEGVRFHAFDAMYEKHDDFETVYEEIAMYLLELAKTFD